jgi:hypothetical protein
VRERRLGHVLEQVAGKHEIDTGVFQEVEARDIADVAFYAFVQETKEPIPCINGDSLSTDDIVDEVAITGAKFKHREVAVDEPVKVMPAESDPQPVSASIGNEPGVEVTLCVHVSRRSRPLALRETAIPAIFGHRCFSNGTRMTGGIPASTSSCSG